MYYYHNVILKQQLDLQGRLIDFASLWQFTATVADAVFLAAVLVIVQIHELTFPNTKFVNL